MPETDQTFGEAKVITNFKLKFRAIPENLKMCLSCLVAERMVAIKLKDHDILAPACHYVQAHFA